MEKYGESIYGTRGGPFRPGLWGGVSTRKGNRIYVHILVWPEDIIELPAIPERIASSKNLTGGEVTVVQKGPNIKIAVPESDRDPIDTIIVLELKE